MGIGYNHKKECGCLLCLGKSGFQKGEKRIPWNKGLTKEIDERIKKHSELLKKHIVTAETREKIRKAKIGKPSKKKGKLLSEEIRKKMSQSAIGKIFSDKSKERMKLSHLGKKHSEETKQKIGMAHKGKKVNTKGKTFEEIYGKENANKIKEKILKSLTGRKLSKEHIEHLSKSHMGHKHSEETIKKFLGRRKMSSLEVKFNIICVKLNIPFEFVGNGKFFIDKKNPDFINKDKKIVVEVFYKKHKCLISSKNKFGIGYDWTKLEKYITERTEIFSKNGWNPLFFDETQVNEKNIMNILGGLKSETATN